MEIVLDSSVLTDMFVKSRPRHDLGRRLSDYIKKNDIRITIPVHAILEVKSAIDSQRLIPGQGEMSKEFFTEDSPLKLNIISIDQKFLSEYHDLSIPYIKSGDLIFILT
jgi:predicted nucleic acid-binding protein